MTYKRRPLIIYLIFGILIVSLVTTVTLSRYMTNVSGNGTINVATIDTNMTSFSFTPTNLNKPGDSQKMFFNIVNFTDGGISEVDQDYTITITTLENIPFTYELQCTNTDGKGTGINLVKSIVTPNVEVIGGKFNHSIAMTHQYELTVTWPLTNKDLSLSEELELVTIIVNAEQTVD